MAKFVKLIKNVKGATAIEYGLIAALIAVAAIGAMQVIGNKLELDVQQRVEQPQLISVGGGEAAVPAGAAAFSSPVVAPMPLPVVGVGAGMTFVLAIRALSGLAALALAACAYHARAAAPLYDPVILNIGINCQWQQHCEHKQRDAMKDAGQFIAARHPPLWKVHMCNRIRPPRDGARRLGRFQFLHPKQSPRAARPRPLKSPLTILAERPGSSGLPGHH